VPIHDLSYRHWDGPLRGAGSRWRVIAEAGIRLLLARRRFAAMLMLAWAPALVQAGILYFALTGVQGVDLPIGAQFFQISMAIQFLPLVLVMVWAGSGLIAGDLAAQALPLYFAKPITRLDYIAGKFGVIVFFLLLVYPAPPLALFLLAAGVAPDLTFLAQNWWVGFSILGYGVLVAVIGSLFILALSSMARSARIASVMFVGLVIFSDMLANLASLVTRSDLPLAFSAAKNMERLADAMFGLPSSVGIPWGLSLGVGVLVAVWSAWTLARRIRPVEIVS